MALTLVWAWRTQSRLLPDRAKAVESVGAVSGQSGWLMANYALSSGPLMVDQILAQILAPSSSGDYVALATLGKLVFYAASPFVTMIYSYLLRHADRPKIQWRFLKLGLLSATLTATSNAIGLTLLGPWLAAQFFPPDYARAIAPLIAPFSWSVIAYVLHNVLVLFALVRQERDVLVPLILGQAVQIILGATNQSSLTALALNQNITYGLLVSGMFVYSFARWRALAPGVAADCVLPPGA